MTTTASISSSTPGAGPSRPTRPPVVQPGSGNSIIINPCQRLNPLLDCIRNVGKEFGEIIPDFRLGRTTCGLFLSLKYHRLHPEYIHQRIQKLGDAFTLRLLILMCDVSEHQDPIRELTKVCLVNNITIIVCWSNEEAGMYLSTYKAFEHKPPDLIKERVEKEYGAMLRASLTSISKVNKTDVETLRTSFGSFAKIAHATPEELRRLPGFGAVKVRRIVDAFDKPFRNKATSVIPASQVAHEALAYGDDIDLAEDMNTEHPQIEHPEIEQNARKTSRVHYYGSAADSELMPPPPPPPTARATVSSPGPSNSRAESPAWDIELDLNEDEVAAAVAEAEAELGATSAQKSQTAIASGDEETVIGAGLDPRLAKKDRLKAANSGRALASPEEGRNAKRPRRGDSDSDSDSPRSPSPVWDIELDLN